ncbi:MAG: cytochrome c biogenesis protein CcdA, partial [Candidatus Nanoarchaeia archaeon]
PLYPAFLIFLSNQANKGKNATKGTIAIFGALITLGVVLFMLGLGLIFTTLFQASLTKVVGIISPIAFGILLLVSLLLIFDVDFSRFLPKGHAPTSKNPYLTSLLYGLFFGAIVLPCNPAFLAALFARAAITTSFTANILNFLFFGIGIGTPLLAFSLLSTQWSQQIIGWLTKYKRAINLVAGLIMLIISVYYLVFVFRVFG